LQDSETIVVGRKRWSWTPHCGSRGVAEAGRHQEPNMVHHCVTIAMGFHAALDTLLCSTGAPVQLAEDGFDPLAADEAKSCYFVEGTDVGAAWPQRPR
jgi:hypothetical protein